MTSSISQLQAAASKIILGKPEVLKLSLSCLLADGHLLIEDIPGVGKTTLAKTLAHLLGLNYRRVQFTSDLLPADIAGVSIFDKDSGAFRFQPGPVFCQVLLADEINRASPKTQSALLEAMEEGQVTSDGETRPLPQPFFVIATQNPLDQVGTFALPESQLDRFMMRLSLGYPSHEAEKQLLLGQSRRDLLQNMPQILQDSDVMELQRQVRSVTCSPALIDYILALVAATRGNPRVQLGLSPRSGLAIKAAAQAWALLDGRSAALPEDVQAIFPHVAGHRIQLAHGDDQGAAVLIRDLLAEVAIP